jgi:hypothetical protein
MKTTVKLAVIALFAAVTTQAGAQTNTNTFTGTLTQNLLINLTGVSAGTTEAKVNKVRITNKDILAAAAQTGRLVLQTDVSSGNGTVGALNGTTFTPIAELSATKVSSGTVVAQKTDKHGLLSGQEYSITKFSSTLAGLSFDVQGFTTDNFRDLGNKAGAFIVRQDSVKANVSGEGNTPNYSILSGSISTSAGKLVTTP